ncbi:helix-turn-helix domain-containing protein [Paenibacillus sp. FSL K6-1096]|uniref:AraC family transcriptional regulator n=1 Tax=Paenibacillus sp. FSL K6-1096 TaxID=2921460 RepID=UPI0030ECFF69
MNRPNGVRDFSLHYIASGSGDIEIGDKTFTLGAGDAFLHFPNDRMRYYCSESDPWNIFWIQFNGNALQAYFLDNRYSGSSIWTLKNASLLQSAFEDLFHELEHYNFLRPSRISTLTYSVIIEFVSNSLPYSSYRSTNHLDKITALLPEMQQKAHLPFELEWWAGQVGLTPNYFCSLFKKATKMTPVSYVTKCRIQKSKQLLLSQPSMSIKEVAILSGYPGISYFNKKFMESEGITPGEFREIH